MRLKVLVADDDRALGNLIADILRKQDYDPILVYDGQAAIDTFFETQGIDLAILDVMMPHYNGFEVLRAIREHSDVPVMMLTALGDEQNEVSGLGHGADDYISKPFSYPVFIARIEALMRKTKRDLSEIIEIGDFKLNRTAHKVAVCDQEVQLNNKEYQLLELLVLNKGIALSRSKILDRVWGYSYDGDDKTINTHIKTLRAKLKPCSNYIVTIKGTGYMFKDTAEKVGAQ